MGKEKAVERGLVGRWAGMRRRRMEVWEEEGWGVGRAGGRALV